MRGYYIVVFLMLFGLNAGAQDLKVKKLATELNRSVKKEVSDTLPWTWKRGGLVNININQGSLSNWASGGDKFSLAVNSYVNYFVLYKYEKHSWDNNLDFNFGYVQSTSLGSRKNDDRLDMLSKYGYNFDGKLFATGLVNFRTQFFDGYTYASNKGTFSSTFLSPAYMLTSAGIDYKPNQNFSAFVSPLTSRVVVVASKFLANKRAYGVDSGKHVVSDFGAFATINYRQVLPRNVSYKGRLDLFSNYLDNPENIDLFMTNYFGFKVGRYFSFNYNLDLIYDDNIKLFGKNGNSPALQVKSLIGVGFTMRF